MLQPPGSSSDVTAVGRAMTLAGCAARKVNGVDAGELTRALLAEAAEVGIDACGVCAAEPYAETERLIGERREAGYFADMGFTIRRPDRSCHPEGLLRNARSVVVAARSYARPEPAKPDDEPRTRFAVYVDSNHHVDREAAARAGIAVYGKNTLAITRRHGSWVVLGVLVTDAELAPTHAAADGPAWDACGSCRACIEACPTGAIVDDGVLDARRCLSWLSQSRLPELPHAAEFGDRVYGCDICQDVCPWNTGAERRAADREPDDVDAVFPPLREWLDADPEALAARYRRLYIPDRDGRHLQRNARVALANVTRE